MSIISRDEIIKAYPLVPFIEKQGRKVVKQGQGLACCCLFHDDKSPSMSVNADKGVWYCHSCGFGGSVIDIVMRQKGMDIKQALKSMAIEAGLTTQDEYDKPRKVATYEYKDAHGRPVMKVDRIESGDKKKFSQYREEKGQRINTVEGVTRVLFRMERWASKPEVSVAEGEKCVLALERLGHDATCNPGGSGGWLDSFALYLAEKHVNVWVDSDEPGEKWMNAVLKSVEGKVASVRVLRVPAPYGDVADLIDAQGDEMAQESILAIMDKAPRMTRGVNLPILSADECLEMYRKSVQAMEENAVDLSKWLPSLRHFARPLLPGDLAVFLSDTGVGKTTALSNIAYSQKPLPTIFFELELSAQAMCERFVARDYQIATAEVEGRTRAGHRFNADGWRHVFVCPESKMTVERMEAIITRAELKMQGKPRLILVDYVGLMTDGAAGKRYERMSTIAEGLKVLARATDTVVIMASQVRRDNERTEVGLHDAKDSGSVENSAQLVLGAWRTAADEMKIRILKQTKKGGTPIIDCKFDGDRQTIKEIHETARILESDFAGMEVGQ